MRKPAVSGGDARLKTGGQLLLFLLLQEHRKRRRGSDHQSRTIATRDILTCPRAESVLFIVGYVHAHVTSTDDTCTELARESWGIKGVKGYGRAPKLYNEYQRGTVLDSEATSLPSCYTI